MPFYVYRLIDPRNGKTFYVGKGQGRRAWQHEVEVRRGKPQGSAQKILQHEYRLIDAGATLTNRRYGQGGCREERNNKLEAIKAAEREVALERKKKQRLAEFLADGKAVTAANEIETWIAGLPDDCGLFPQKRQLPKGPGPKKPRRRRHRRRPKRRRADRGLAA